jgi:hypothetical protein
MIIIVHDPCNTQALSKICQPAGSYYIREIIVGIYINNDENCPFIYIKRFHKGIYSTDLNISNGIM